MPRTARLASGVPFDAHLSCWAAVAPGLESLASAELARIGITPGTAEPGGVPFDGDAATLARALVALRIPNDIQVRLAAFRANAFGELERHAGRIDWSTVICPGGAVHFRVTSKKSRLYHQDAIAERLERSVHAAVRNVRAVRAAAAAAAGEADVTQLPAVQRIIVRVFRDSFTISADAAGASLHRRGWRQDVARAPLRETLAAALLASIAWSGDTPLVDPFCGSGTIAIEAAQIARRMAPGRRRRFAAECWDGLLAGVVPAAQRAARDAERPGAAVAIRGADRDAGAIAAARANAARADVERDVRFDQAPVSALRVESSGGWIATNPPYGARIGERRALRDLYAAFGNVVRMHCPEWGVAFFSADPTLDAQTGLDLRLVARTTNGGIPVHIVRTG
jgi:putative N6-adenine-specific DNA methylase